MSNEFRTTVGGRRGYKIERVLLTDTEGNVVNEFFELYDLDGNLIGIYPLLEDAEDALDKEIDHLPPSPGMGM